MIAVPLHTNLHPGELEDDVCLGAITEEVARWVRDRDPEILALAAPHRTTASLIEELRSRPFLADEGNPAETPKVDACSPAQRLRKNPAEFNCVEAAAHYLAIAEHIDPGPVRRLATVNTPNGLHTFPVENGEPVILDPYHSRNALAGALFRQAAKARNASCIAMTPERTVAWVAKMAEEPACAFRDGGRRVCNGHRAVRALFIGEPLCMADAKDIAFMLALAGRESHQWGPAGPRIVEATARAVDKLDQAAAEDWKARTAPAVRNAPELRIGGYTLRPDTALLGALGRVGVRLGMQAGIEALRIKLAMLGASPAMLSTVERELNREGRTLGALATPPPMIGSLAALTPEALAGRWLASKL